MTAPNKKALQIKSLSRDLISYVRLYGVIDETFDPVELLNSASGRDVILNLKALTRISSFGVREWVHAMEKLSKRTDRIALVECSPAVVAQLNMVANFAANTNVVSVQVPYYCESCSWDTEVTRELDRDLRKEFGSLPPVLCRRCKSTMILDDEAVAYFAFQAVVSGKAVDPALAAFISDFATAIDGDEKKKDSTVKRPAGSKAPAGERAAAGAGNVLLPLWVRLKRAWEGMSVVQRIAVSGLTIVVLVLLVMVAVFRGPGSSSTAGPLISFHTYLRDGRLAEAGALLEKLAPSLSQNDLASYRALLDKERAAAGARETERAVTEHRNGRFAEAVSAGMRAQALAPLNADGLFALAESLRQVGRLNEAIPHYKDFAERYPQDARLDDAIFWRAEYLASIDKNAAIDLYRRLVDEFPNSNFKRSAKKKMDSLR